MIRQGLVATVVVAAAVIAAVSLLLQPLLVLAGVAAILFLVFSVRIIRHPRATAVAVCLLVFLAETKFRQRDADAMLSGSVDAQVIFELAMYAALGWIVILALICPAKPARRLAPWIAYGLGGYGALALLSTTWSAAPAITLVRSVQLCILVAVVLCLSLRADPATILESLLTALVLYCGIFAILAIVVPGGAPRLDLPGGKAERFSWFAVHPGAVAMYCAVTVLLLIAALLNGLPRMPRSRRLTLGFAGIAVFGAVLLATRSRTDLIAIALTIGALLIRRMRLRHGVLVAGMLGCVAIIGFAVTNFGAGNLLNSLVSDNWAGDYLLRGQTTDQFLTLSSRTMLWKDMIPLIAARPVLGWGFEASRKFLLNVFFWASYAHNALVQTVLGLGACGVALLMPLFGSCFFVGERYQPTRDGPAFARTAVIACAIYFGIQSIASESFAGTPGFAVLVVFVCMLTAADLRLQARESTRATPFRLRAAPVRWSHASPVLEERPA